ncbi:hypothetical protein GCM10017776_30030 [Streptomyces griseoluteus]|nr:hypothetical protein GCM10017776_30030 [Streptomyces griseoluteus]
MELPHERGSGNSPLLNRDALGGALEFREKALMLYSEFSLPLPSARIPPLAEGAPAMQL